MRNPQVGNKLTNLNYMLTKLKEQRKKYKMELLLKIKEMRAKTKLLIFVYK